jgi:transcription elongation factor GreA
LRAVKKGWERGPAVLNSVATSRCTEDAVLEAIKERLRQEVADLQRELRVDLPQEIKRALAHGDLRENAEYQAALERQSFVKARIGQLQKRLSDLSMIKLSQIPRDRIAFGSRVVLQDLESEEEVVYELVLNDDADPKRGQISVTSPLGRGLMGHREGDEIEIRIPSGTRTFDVIELRTLHDAVTEKGEE